MANQISGKILLIENAVDVPTKNNGVFTKRRIVLDASHYDPMTGQKFENYPVFDFVMRNVPKLDSFKAGDMVTISFALNGRPFEKDGKKDYFTSVVGYDIVPYQRQNGNYQQPNSDQPATSQGVQNSTNEQSKSQQGEQSNVTPQNEDDLPF